MRNRDSDVRFWHKADISMDRWTQAWGRSATRRKSDVFHCGAECLLLAQSGHPDTLSQCPLLGVKRTLLGHCGMSGEEQIG
jgi:hypothetical protein